MTVVSFRTMLVAFAFMLLVPSASYGIDMKAMGFTDVTQQWADTDFSENSRRDRFQGTQRTRAWILFNPGQAVRGTLMFEIDNIWGSDQAGMRGGNLGTDGLNLGVKEAYINWAVPDTSIRVRMGLQPFILPGIGPVSPLTRQVDSVTSMWARAAGILVSGDITENVGLTTFWVRPSNDNAKKTDKRLADSADLVGMVLPIKGDGFDVSPWIMYSRAGKDDPLFTYRPTLIPAYPVHATPSSVEKASRYADGWWGGVSANVSLFDPWRFGIEANYAGIDGVVREMDRSGWYVSALTEYAARTMIPGVLAWYASGDDANPWNGSERMPTILGNWQASSMGFSGGYDNLAYQSLVAGMEPTGTWGVSLYVRDIALLEKMTQTARVLYYRGTNSNAMADFVRDGYTKVGGVPTFLYLTKSDSVFEMNLNNTWEIMPNLYWGLEASLMHLKRGDNWHIPDSKPNAIRLASTFRFIF